MERARQTLGKMALEPEWEAVFEPNSYGFRPGRSCHDAIEQIHTALRKEKYIRLCRKFAFETICATVSPDDLRCTERESNDGDQFQRGPFSTRYHSHGRA